MKFSEVSKGTRAERSVELPLTESTTFKTLVRPLTGDEETTALRLAREHAIANGLEHPKEGEPLYDLAYMANIIAIGCIDPDSPENARTPSFEGGAAAILKDDHLGRERIAFLYEHHELWQDTCSPQKKRMSAVEMVATVAKLAEAEDDGFLLRLGPALRASLLRITARTSLPLLADKLRSGIAVDTGGQSSKKPDEKKPSENES